MTEPRVTSRDFASFGPATLDLTQPVEQLTADLLDIFSVSGEEAGAGLQMQCRLLAAREHRRLRDYP